jgi:hypothetical protein
MKGSKERINVIATPNIEIEGTMNTDQDEIPRDNFNITGGSKAFDIGQDSVEGGGTSMGTTPLMQSRIKTNNKNNEFWTSYENRKKEINDYRTMS